MTYSDYTQLDAAILVGGFDIELGKALSTEEIAEYFTRENFERMFAGEDCSQCGGYSLDECRDAVLEHLSRV